MDKKSIAIEIEKYFNSPLRPSFPELIKLAIDVRDDGLTPTRLTGFSIDENSIEQSPVEPEIYAFSANGVAVYTDKASGIGNQFNVSFSGLAHVVDQGERMAVDCLTIDYLHRTSAL